MKRPITRREAMRGLVAFGSAALTLSACRPAASPGTNPNPTAEALVTKPADQIQTNRDRAMATYQVIKSRFAVPGTRLFHEHVKEKQDDRRYSYLWPYSAVLSGASALARMKDGGAGYHDELKTRLDALNDYYDPASSPRGYDSYVRSDGGGDKFYDDNEWLGLDFIEGLRILGDKAYLENAKEIFAFAISGWDDEQGGGIHWKQGDKTTRNTCSNGPAAVLALELYHETKDSQYLDWAKKILDWLKPLKSPEVGVYMDNINESGVIDQRFYTYNTGTPLHASALLFAITGDGAYLDEARALAAASYAYFAQPDVLSGKRLFPDTSWFNAVLLRGYLALYAADPDHDRTYIDAMQENADFAWDSARDADGAFAPGFTGRAGLSNPSKALIDQGAMVEIYARLSEFSI